MDWQDIEGMRPLNDEEKAVLKEFLREMKEVVVPANIEYEKKQRRLRREDRGPLF